LSWCQQHNDCQRDSRTQPESDGLSTCPAAGGAVRVHAKMKCCCAASALILFELCGSSILNSRLLSTEPRGRSLGMRKSQPNCTNYAPRKFIFGLRGGTVTNEIDGAETAAIRLRELKAGGQNTREWTNLLTACISLAEAGDVSCARRAVEVIEAMTERGLRSPLQPSEISCSRTASAHKSAYEQLFDVCERSRLLPECLRLLALHERTAPRAALLARADAVLGSVSSRLDEQCAELDELAASRTLADDGAWEVCKTTAHPPLCAPSRTALANYAPLFIIRAL
jgi:hypothetical protein